MKKLAIVAAFLGLGMTVLAQDCLTIKTVNKVQGLPAEYEAMAESESITYTKGEKTKTEMSSMMFSIVTLMDGEKMTVTQEAMGNKSGYVMTKAEMEESEKSEKEKPNKPKIEYTSEKKTILGYECTKAIITSVGKDKKEIKATAWVTDKIKRPATPKGQKGSRMMSGPDLGDLNGFPMEMSFTQSQQGMDLNITVTTTEVKTDKLDDSIFKIDTEGYKMMTYKEMKEQMKAAQAGQK
jgi:hypothetical protein